MFSKVTMDLGPSVAGKDEVSFVGVRHSFLPKRGSPMETTIFLSKIVGPVLIIRGISILYDQEHFKEMVAGLPREVSTVAFSLFPIALMMTGIAMVLTLDDRSSLAAIVFYLMGWGAIIKASLLIMFPKIIVAKARLLVQAGFLNVVLFMCLALGLYLTWFGYFNAGTGT